jgi:hypothetical protein
MSLPQLESPPKLLGVGALAPPARKDIVDKQPAPGSAMTTTAQNHAIASAMRLRGGCCHVRYCVIPIPITYAYFRSVAVSAVFEGGEEDFTNVQIRWRISDLI